METSKTAIVLRSLVAVGLLLIAAFVSLRWLPAPFIWILGCASALSFWLYRSVTGVTAIICWNIGIMFLAFGGFEVALQALEFFQQREEARIDSFQLYESNRDPILGNALKPATQRTAWKSWDGEKLYEVTYTIGADGLRVSPECGADCASSIAFFGGSFAYGEGVEDDETLPYRVGEAAVGHQQVYNFAIHGHGPQHMLAVIESGRLAATVAEPPAYAIYLALYPEHVYRAAGLRPWVKIGPRYLPDGAGSVELAGTFLDERPAVQLPARVAALLSRAAAGRLILNYVRTVGPDDDQLFAAIVIRAAQELRVDNPALEFHLIIWGDAPAELLAELAAANITLHSANTIIAAAGIPAIEIVIPHDGHPTAATHQALADYVTEQIVGVAE